jgi:glycosyltransferase involved in cell wall biosynthesis
MLFVSPRFLFPADSGGKIRTLQVLRGMKGRCLDITLVSPAAPGARETFAAELEGIADRFEPWPAQDRSFAFGVRRMRHLLSDLPISVKTDQSTIGRSVIMAQLAKKPDVVVFDFAHSVVLAPDKIPAPTVLFTHNIEAEIFRRHAQVAGNILQRAVWRNQFRKMQAFERRVLQRFDAVVAVSDRDREYFETEYAARNVSVIRTGVDLDYFTYAPSTADTAVVFTGSMDWLANIDGIRFMMEEIWPRVREQVPLATMTVVGRNPPHSLVEQGQRLNAEWKFSGFVDDVRPYVRRAAAFVIPLRVGGGTRIKAFEAMAMGCPVVSTSIGVEGLELEAGRHYLRADSATEFISAIVRLLRDAELRWRLSREARTHVERRFSSAAAAKDFEDICLRVASADRSEWQRQSVRRVHADN